MDYFVWNIDPALFRLGSLQLRYYGILFVGSFFIAMYVAARIFESEGKESKLLEPLLFYALIGTIVGSRLMHCFAYEPQRCLSNPIEIIKVWEGGLASHGGLLGVLIAFWLFSKRYNVDFFWLISRIAIVGPIVAAAVRIGNFFNSEILGRATDVPWAVIFARIDTIPRHPVQLYEAVAYLLFFLILYVTYRRVGPQRATHIIPGLFLVLMFSARFMLEFFKTEQATYELDSTFTVGQMLSLPLIAVGIVWLIYGLKRSVRV